MNGLLGVQGQGQGLNGLLSPAMMMGLGLMQMGQERPVTQAAPTGLLNTATQMALFQAKDRRESEAARAKAQQAAEQSAQLQRVLTAVHAKEMTPAQAYAVTGNLPGGREAVQALTEQMGLAYQSPEKDPLAAFRAYRELPPNEQSAYIDWRKSGAMNVDLSDKDANKRLTTTEIRNLVMPDGTHPPYGMTQGEAAALGAQPMSLEEAEQRKLAGRIAMFEREVERTRSEYERLKAEYDADPTNLNKRRELANAAASYQHALGQRRNISGEASDFVQRRVDIPGPVRGQAEGVLQGLLNWFSKDDEPPPPGFKVD